MYTIASPSTQRDWERYYELRWMILREPWQQPRGSEKDEHEANAFHCMAVDANNNVVGTGRIHKHSKNESQIRYMAVANEHRHKGLGGLILQALENKAREWGSKTIILNARDTCADFYVWHGYTIKSKGHTLFGSIQHTVMKKSLNVK